VTGLDSPGRKKERALTCGAVLSATKEEKREGARCGLSTGCARWAGTGKELGCGAAGPRGFPRPRARGKGKGGVLGRLGFPPLFFFFFFLFFSVF
jgi:hypothetical protein